MDSIKADGELAAEMVVLLGRELKVARKRIQELEGKQDSVAELTKRAEGAEAAMKILQKHSEDERAEKEKFRRFKLANQCKKEPGNDNLMLSQDDSQSARLEEMAKLSKEQDEKIDDLQKAVEKYRGKYQKAREAKRLLQETCDEQEKQIRSLMDRASAPPHCQGCDRIINGSGTMHESRFVFNKKIGSLPRYPGRPNFQDMLPVCHKGVDLHAYLSADPECLPYTKKMFYAPGRLTWCSAAKHHALASGPMFMLDSDKILWKRDSIFDGLYDQTVELFYNCKDLIYYGGQFKCHNNRRKNPEGDRVQQDTSISELVDATIQTNQEKRYATRKMVVQLYTHGILKMENLGLQCVGFDHELYNTLVKRFNVNNPSLKREGSQRLDSDRKVKRAKSSAI